MKLSAFAAALIMCSGLAIAQPQHDTHQPATHQPATTTKTTTTGTTTYTQPKTTKAAPDMNADPAMKAMQEEWAKAGALAPENIELAKSLSGTWDAKTTMWMDPSTPPMVSNAKATFEPIMGARYVRQTYTGDVAGMEFKGEGVFGFNKGSKEYQSSWFDSGAPGIMLASGTKNAKGEIVFNGTYDCPMTGEKKTGKSVLRFDAKDKMTFEMWNVASDGAEFKALEIAYTRTGPATTTNTPNVGTTGRTPMAPATTTNTPTTPKTTGEPNHPK